MWQKKIWNQRAGKHKRSDQIYKYIYEMVMEEHKHINSLMFTNND